ncbi:hypothetical protein [Aureibacter tunicatorum]|uniref:Uncharacterized protein n=1 Tax=Aureibacter tunicatorum TaxID=866807 RepID=A0AAE4BU34_9BACT|nr:hypothetical protein [Aureibacter tunicatorum]MDR6241376.1 hypothetical protein [Aureibacter tunicatorum]BDD06779.1 hypothetical protein AUTU_42620 [Aureibacter tunicatorum]
MDLEVIIIGSITIAICAIPFVLYYLNNSKNERIMIDTLKNFARENKIELTQHEICGKYIIGLDEPKLKLCFISRNENEFTKQFIELNDFKSSEIIRISIKSRDNYSVLNQLHLVFKSHKHEHSDISIEFFNTKHANQLSGELQSIEEWNIKINNLLTQQK